MPQSSAFQSLAVRLLLIMPNVVDQRANQLAANGAIGTRPTKVQLAIGSLRMWHRLAFRSDSVGLSKSNAVRKTWRAKLLQYRPLRFPFLVWERAIAPLDFTGLLSSRERIIRHLLAAHHDDTQCVYDLELLSADDGALDELAFRLQAVIDGRDPRSDWLKDLVVFENYHAQLAELVSRVRGRATGDTVLAAVDMPPEEKTDPDVTLNAFMKWCAEQPQTVDYRGLQAAIASLSREAHQRRGPTPKPITTNSSATTPSYHFEAAAP